MKTLDQQITEQKEVLNKLVRKQIEIEDAEVYSDADKKIIKGLIKETKALTKGKKITLLWAKHDLLVTIWLSWEDSSSGYYDLLSVNASNELKEQFPKAAKIINNIVDTSDYISEIVVGNDYIDHWINKQPDVKEFNRRIMKVVKVSDKLDEKYEKFDFNEDIFIIS